MHHNFFELFSPLSRFTFGAHKPDVDNEVRIKPSMALEHAGIRDLTDIIDRRGSDSRVRLGHIDDRDELNQYRSYLTTTIKKLFASEDELSPATGTRGGRAIGRNAALDVHRIGECCGDLATSRVEIYNCRYGEPRKRDICLAIPSLAGLEPPHAVSMVNPLSMTPREYVNTGEVGAIVTFTPNTFSYSADIYWSKPALIESLNNVQQIGRTLILNDALNTAILSGVGIVDVGTPSAILSKAYETVARLGQSLDTPFFPMGIWGVAVKPVSRDIFILKLGCVALEVPPIMSSNDLTSITGSFTASRRLAVVDIASLHDHYGFVAMSPANYSLHPLGSVDWEWDLPEIR